jgi:hypothetical protein
LSEEAGIDGILRKGGKSLLAIEDGKIVVSAHGQGG